MKVSAEPETIRVLHIGDVHLGVELYGRPDPERGYGSRVGDFLVALDRALESAADADIVLFPGDIYKNCDPSPTVQREFARRIRRVARDVPVVIIPGNHDVPNTFARASSIDIFHVLEVENVSVLRTPEMAQIMTRRGAMLIAPLPFLPRSKLLAQEEARGKTLPELLELMRTRLLEILDDLVVQVRQARERLGASVPAVLMAHYTVAGAVFGGYGKGGLLAPEVELPLSAVKNEAFDYVAMAHIHKHQPVPAANYTSQPPVVYPGSIERVDFGEEDEDKVAVLATVTRGSTTWNALPLHPRPFVTIRAEISENDAEPLEAVRAAVERHASRLPGAIVRLVYSQSAGSPNLSERDLRALLEGAHFIASIRRETPRGENRTRHGGMTTQLAPLEALQEYLRTQPQLAGQAEDLLLRAAPLIDEVTFRRRGENG